MQWRHLFSEVDPTFVNRLVLPAHPRVVIPQVEPNNRISFCADVVGYSTRIQLESALLTSSLIVNIKDWIIIFGYL